jgi:hypothetical protein
MQWSPFLGSEPAQASWAMISEFGGLAAHRFLHLSFANRAGHHAVPNDALMNVPPVVLFAQSLVHDERNQAQKAPARNITIMNVIIISKVLRLVLMSGMLILRGGGPKGTPALSSLDPIIYDENVTPAVPSKIRAFAFSPVIPSRPLKSDGGPLSSGLSSRSAASQHVHAHIHLH